MSLPLAIVKQISFKTNPSNYFIPIVLFIFHRMNNCEYFRPFPLITCSWEHWRGKDHGTDVHQRWELRRCWMWLEYWSHVLCQRESEAVSKVRGEKAGFHREDRRRGGQMAVWDRTEDASSTTAKHIRWSHASRALPSTTSCRAGWPTSTAGYPRSRSVWRIFCQNSEKPNRSWKHTDKPLMRIV